MRFLEWLNRCLGKTPPAPNLEFNSLRADSHAGLELVRLEERIVLNVDAGLSGAASDVLEINLDAANDEATVSVVDGGATIQVDDGLGLPDSIMQFDATQINSILVTGVDTSQSIQFLGQNDLIIPDALDLTGFTGNVKIGIEIQVGTAGAPDFSTQSTVTYFGQYDRVGDQLNVVLQNQVGADDSFAVQFNGNDVEILDQNNANALLYSTSLTGLNSIQIQGADGETDLLALNYGDAQLTQLSISFDGGLGGNDALEFFGGTFDTVTHNLTGPGAGAVDFSGNAITEISYTGLEPVFGGSNTANNVVINLPTATTDAILENATLPGEMQIRSLSSSFELTTFASPANSLQITTAGGASIVELNSYDASFAPTDLILSGQAGDTYQLAGSDLLDDSVALTLSGGATLDLGSFDETVAQFTLEDGTVIATGGILTSQSDLDLRSGSVKAQLNGNNLIKNGSGTVILDALNGYTGSTSVNDGTLQLAQSNAIPNTSSVDLTSATSVLDLNGFSVSLTSLTGTGSVLLGGPAGSLTLNQAILTSATFAGDISGDGSLTIAGAGEVILSGNSSFTGATSVQDGVLKVEGTLATSEVIVATGATLGGSGSITAPVTINADAALVPGSSPGILSTGDLTLDADADLNVEINGTTAGSDYDQIQVTGDVDLTGATLNISSSFTAAAGDQFLLIDNDDVDAVTGNFVGLAEGTLFSFNGNQVYITYQGGDGNDVVLTVNSPPSAGDQSFSIDENTANTTSVGTIIAADPNIPPGSLTFSLTGGSGDTAFAVSSTGEITVADFTQLDYETDTEFDLEILVTDDAGATDTATITININPLNDNDPVIANQTREVDENATNGTLVGAVIVASDADQPGDTLTFTEAGGTGSAAFDITSTGQIIVANQSLINFETNPSYTLDVIVDDNAGSTATATVTINLNDLVESMVVTAGDWSSNDITIIRDGSQLRILETGTSNEIVPSHEFDKVSSIIITGNGSDNTVRLDMSVDTILPPSGISFDGAGGSNTLVSADQTTDWLINGMNSGSLLSGAVNFSNVENLTGNAGADAFTFQDGGQLTGTLSGGDGMDQIDFSAVTSAVTVDLQTSSASGVNLFNTIENLSGDDTQDTISGLSAGTTYLINGVNQGSVSGIDFDGFNHLAGSTGSDAFQFSGSGQITGSIDGLGGVDILDYSASTFSLDLALSATGSTDGFTGTEASTVADFDNIDTIQGSSNTDALAGINAVAVWSLDGSNQYTASNTLNFSDFENLTGGTDVDAFNISGSQSLNLSGNSGNDVFAFADGATLTGTIDGQAGADQIDFSALTSSIDVVLIANGTFDGFQGTEASISGGFDNINDIAAGSGAADKLTGQNAAATWSIQLASVYGSGTSLSFSSFETLQGGNDVDQFNINGSHTLDLLGGQGADVFRFSNDGSTLNGTIDGEAGSDHLNLDNYITDLNVTLSGLGGIDGFDGSESAKSISFANIDVLTGGSGNNTLTGIDSAATWTMNGVNTYNSTNTLTFSNFVNLTGGSAADSFQVTPDAEAFNIVGGDPTSNPLGDELHVDTSAAGTAVVSNNGDGSGSVTGSFPTVTYSEIENFTITGTVDIELQGTVNADNIEILVNGSDIEYRLGGTLIGTSALSGTTSISVKGGDGDDSLTIDSALAAAGITVDYDGEGQDSTSPGDVLNLLGTTTSVEYFFVDSSSGSIRIDGAGTDFITYSGLEPITSTINTTNVTLNYSAVAEIITISDAGGGQTTVTSTAGELLTFTNPDGLLTINTGDGADQIELNSLATDFTASLTINGEGAADILNVNGSLTFDSGKNVELNVESITVANATVLAAASIALNADTVDLDGDLLAATVSGDAATVNVLGAAGGADIQDAVDVAGTGGVINIAAGIYHTTGTLEIDESVSLIGAGKDVVEIRKAGAPTNTFDVAVNISANNVSISGAQLGWETHTSATDYRGYVVYTNADNSTLNNLLFGDNYRSAVVFEGANNLEVSDSIFEGNYGRAAIRDGDGGSGENFLITRNEFRENHFRWGPIAIGPQGTFGDPNNHAFSGEISFNYFGNGLEAGAFQEAGDQNYTVTITNRGMTADGIDINHNTFDWQDSSTTNSNGIYAQPGGIYFDPSLAVPANSVNITNNIFNGFSYEGPQPSATTPAWDPTGGVFGGALEFDGVDDFGLFQSANFDVGESGTLSFWVNMDDQGRRNQFFEGPNNGGMEFQFRSNSGGQFFGSPNRNDGNGNTYIIQDGSAGGTTGDWQNIQYTWDFNGGVNPEMHLYIDGVEVGYLSGTYDSDLSQWTATVSTINELMNVGRDPGDSGRFFDGKMDDVGWFDQALGQTDLDTIRSTGVSALSGDARLVAHWDFDQSSGDIAVDNVSGIQMYLVTDGIVPFGPEFQETAGVFGGALDFDGIDDFATFQDASFDVGRKGTLNFWVKMDDVSRRNQFFEGPDNGGFEFQYRTNSGGQFFGRTQDGGDYTIQSGGQSVNGGIWTNIQYTWDADTGEMHIYINGSEEPYLSSYDENLSGFDSTHFTDTVNGLMNVGQDPGDSGRFFDGLMDDIGWFNDVLDSTDRATIMNTGVSSMTGDSRLVAHWNLDDPSGTEIVSGDSGTNITLYLQANPPLPPIEGFGVIAPLNANVTYNAFNGNDLDSNVPLDSTNTFGDPLFAYANDPNYIPTDSLATQYVIGFGSSAAYGSSEFAADTDTSIPHIGAFQNLPTVYPGIYGSGDIVVYGTGEDDQLVLTLTGENTATFVLTRDFGGPNELVLASVSITDITSITFNGLGGDDVLIVNQPDNLFFNPTDGITFNGGSQNNDGNSLGIAGILGDTLVLNHSVSLEADSVGYVFTPDNVPAEGEDGIITISDSSMTDGSTTIAFTGLEPILDNLLVADRDFDFTDADETISLSDDGVLGDNYSFIDSTLSESVQFLNPTNSITIRTDSVGTPAGVDTVLVNSLDSLFSASLSIFAGADDPVTFQSMVNLGTGDLFVTAESVNILADIDAASVEISSSGVTSTTFNGGTVTTTGSQLYHDAVNFVTNSTLTSSGGSNIQFNDTVDGTIDLQIDTAGTTIFNGAIGSNSPLSSLTTNAGGTTQINGGSIQTSGNQIFNDDVDLGANTVLTSTASGAITFNQRLNGTYTLELNTDGDTTFNGTVGDTNELASLTTDANGTTFINGGSIATEGGQLFNDAVLLGANTILSSSASGSVSFKSTLNGAHTLNINTAGSTIFDDQVGNSAALTSLTTDASGSTQINGGSIETTGDQIFHDQVELGANSILTSTGSGELTFNNTLNGSFTLNLNTDGNTTFNGTVGNYDALTSLTTDANGTTNINGGSVATTGGQFYNDMVQLGANSVLSSSSSGTIQFVETLNGGYTLNANTDGTTIFDDQVGNSAALTSLTTDAIGTTQINGGSIDTTGDQIFNDDVELGANTVLTSTGSGAITFNQRLNGTFTLQLNTDGNTTFNGTVGDTNELVSLTTDTNGTTYINGGSIETTFEQIFNDAVELGANTILTSSTSGALTFQESLNGPWSLNLNTSGTTTFNSLVGNSAALASLTTNAGGTTELNGGSIETTGDQIFNDDVELGANTTLASTSNGAITFDQTLNGGFTLDLNTAGVTTFNGTVGNTNELTSLTTDADGTTNINGGSVATSGGQFYNDMVQLGANTVLSSSSSGTIQFVKTLNGAYTLNVNSDGTTMFDDQVGNSAALISLTTNTNGTTQINGGSIDTTGDQIFNDDVELGANTVLTSTGSGAITFNQRVNGTHTLELNTDGDTTFNGTVGDTNELVSLTTDANGTTFINGGSIATEGGQLFNDAVLLGANTALSSSASGSVNFKSTLNGAHTLNINTAGTTIFDDQVGNSAALTSLTTDVDGTTEVNGGTITTTGGQTFHDIVTLGGSTVFTSTTVDDITFDQTLTGGNGITIQISSTDDVIFKNAVSTDGAVTVTADSDISGTGNMSMETGSSVDAGTGSIDIDGANVLTRSLTTTNGTTSAVTIDAHNGNVVTRDNGVNALGDITINATGSITLEDNGVNTGEGGSVTVQADGDVISTGNGVDTTNGAAAGGNINVTSTAGQVDLSNGSLLTGDGGSITVNAVTGFTTLNTSLDTTTGTGGGSVEANVSNGTMSITGGDATVNGAGSILLTAKGTTSDIQLDTNLTSADGSITLLADNDITLSATTSILSQASGSITLTADNDGSNVGSITMDSGSRVESQGGQIQISAAGDIALSGITTTGGRVDITSALGGITDNDSSGVNNVTASQLVLNSNLGIGQLADAIDTAIAFLEADAGTGGLFLDNTGALTIGGITAQDGLDADLDIVIHNPGTLNVTETVQSASGSITLDATDTLTVDLATTISTLGTGAILLTSNRNIKLNSGSNLKTVNGGITLLANDGGLTAGDFIGVEAENATISTTGTGNILITGFGGADVVTSDHHGVFLHSGTTISSSASGIDAGTITINGTAGEGINDNHGVMIDGAGTNITSVDGAIGITGTTDYGAGFVLSDQAQIVSNGAGVNAADITILGTTTADLAGVQISSLIQSTAGAISITGESSGGGTTSQGTLIETTNGLVINEDGQITINGTSNGDDGLEISNDAVVSASGTGNIELLGESTGSGSGIHLNATVKSNTGTVTLTAEDDLLLGSVALIDSTSGTVTLTADNAAGSNGNPITMTDGSLIDAGTGTINLTADGDVLLAGLLTSGTVNVDSLSAAISDNGDSHTDIVASTAVLNAVTGIGVGNPLEAEISTLSATVSGVGNLLIDNGIAVELLDLSTFDGAITVNNTASLTATSVVSQNDSNSDDNDITLNAMGTNSDILVTTITATGLADVMLTAEDGILDTNGADSNRITADDLNMSSSSAGGTQDGIDVDTDVNSVTADVNTNAGGLRIDEVDGITLTQLTTFDGFIIVNAAGTIEALDVTSTNNSSSDLNNGITLTATGVDSDILVTSLTAENTADITLNADRDVLDSDSADSQLTSGDLLTIVAGRNIGGITNVFTADGFDPLQTSVGHLNLTSGDQIVIDNTGTTPELINLDAGTGTAGTTSVRATGGALDASATTGISNTQDTISFISDVSITVPTGLQTANLRLDAPDIIDAGGGAIDVNAVNSILFKSGSAETVNITAQQFDGTALGSDFVINNDSPALELVDLNEDNLSLTGGTDTNISLSSAGSITVSDLVQTLGTGTLFLETTNTDADLILNHNLLSNTGSVTISTANDIQFNGTTNLTSTSGAVSLTADADNGAGGLLGGITMADGTFINAGDGAVSLIASDDIVLSQIMTDNDTSSAILIDTDSSLVDAGDSTGEDLIANESGARVTIIASLGAGKVADLNGHLETHIDQINITNQTAGEIRIIETDDLIVHDLLQSTAGDIEVFTTGSILLNGLIETASDNVLLDSKAAIIDQNDGVPGELNIHATSLDMNAVTGIGTGDTLEMSVDTFSADTTDGDVLLHNTATTGVTGTSITTGTGNINLEQEGNESLTIDLVTTVDGSIAVANTGDAQSDTLTLTSLSAGGATPVIDVSTLNFGNILLGDLVALEGSIAVTSAGEINDAVDDQGAPEVDLNAASGSITLEAVNGIGNSDPIEVSARTLAVNSNTGDLNLHHVSSAATGSVTVTKLTTGTGDINYEQTGQESASFEEISTTDSDITVNADGSLLFENPGVLLNVVETDGSGTIEVTATGVNSSIEINDGFSTAGGTIDLTAQHSLNFGSEGDLSSSDGKITLLADSASVGAGGGGITMSDGTVFDAGVGIVDLQAGDSITVGQLMTTTMTRLTTTDGGIVDAGDTGGRDIIADDLVIRSATGAGSANALETAVSLLSAHNTDSGHVQIHNDLGGALLTIGTVDGLAGITHSGSVAGDIFVSNASPLTVDSPVTNGSGGNIGLESTGPGDLTLNASVRAFGGNGNIDLQAGNGFLAINDTGVASDHSVAGTGVLSGHGDSGVLIDANTTMNSETGAIAGLPPDLRNILTPQIQPTGLATVTGDFGRFTEQNFFITIDWGDGTVETFNFSDPGSFVFEHTYTANPDAGNPAADIPILVTMQGDKQFTFSDGNGTLDFTSEADVLETPGEGLATVAIDTTPQVPQLIFPQQEVILDASSLQQTVFNMRETQLLETAIGEANRNAERLIFLRILAPNGDVIEDVPLQESDLDNLPKLFSTLPDGRYQIYLKEAGEERVRLLMDVDIRNGKASDVTEEQSNPPTSSEQQPPANNNINSQLEDQEQRALSLSDLEQLTTIIMTDAGEADLSDRIDLLLQILINETSDWEPLLTPGSDVNNVQEQPTFPLPAEATAQLETSEKAWGSAALLSGYFHGRSLFRKPVTQNECESAMEKYGSRLLNRRYKLNRRQK